MDIQGEVVELLKERGMTLSAAESCTAGEFCARLVDCAGASQVFKEAYITYCDEAKNKLLGVRQETLDKYTAVSAQCACEMAEGALEKSGADIAVSITGYAGPGGSDAGLVYVGLCSKFKMGEEQTKVNKYLFKGDRAHVRSAAAKEALKLVRYTLSD